MHLPFAPPFSDARVIASPFVLPIDDGNDAVDLDANRFYAAAT